MRFFLGRVVGIMEILCNFGASSFMCRAVDAGSLAVAGQKMDGVLHNCKSVTNALSVG